MKINPDIPDPIMVREAADLIEAGGVIVYPTTGLYGLGADAFNSKAVERIFKIKQRPADKPLLIMLNNSNELDRLVQHIPLPAASIMEHFWPGRITIVFEANATLPSILTAQSGRIGIRVPDHRVAFALVTALGIPITGTSANISGNAGCSRVADLDSRVVEHVDLILDAGALKGGPGSTVIDVTVVPPKILREGAITAREIFAVLNQATTS